MNFIHFIRRMTLFVFLLCGFITLTSALFSNKLGWISDTNVFYITYFGYACIPLLILFYKQSLFSRIPYHWGLWLLIFFGYSVVLVLLGFLSTNPIDTWLVDSVTFTAFSGFIFLGTSDAFWKDFQKFGFYFFVAAVLVNIQATTMVNVNYWLSEENLLNFKGSERITRSIVGYKTQFAMSFWPLFLLTVNPQNKGRLLFMLFVVLFLILQQIVFQKRGPIVRVLFFVGCFVYLALKSRKYHISSQPFKKVIMLFIVLILTSFFLFKQYLPADLIVKQYSSLINRFKGDTGNDSIKYTKGALGIFTSENERIREVGIMFNSMSPGQVIAGKYFGGKYEDREIMERARDATHIGFFNFMLKGGVIYLGLFVLMVFSVLVNVRKCKRDRELIACYLVFFGMTLFLLAEGWFYYRAAVYDLLLYGIVIGRLIMIHRNREIHPAPARIQAMQLA